MALRTIRHVSFSYFEEVDDPIRPGEKILTERKAARGMTVDIPIESDLQRGERFGAFESTEPVAEPASETTDTSDDEVPVSEMTDEELIAWIKDDKPTVGEVVDAAEGDPDQARRLLAAEDSATGGDSRRGVVSGLAAILNQAQ